MTRARTSSQELWAKARPRVPITQEARDLLNAYRKRHGLANLSVALQRAISTAEQHEQPK